MKVDERAATMARPRTPPTGEVDTQSGESGLSTPLGWCGIDMPASWM
jgi:hypothetical protein